MVRIGKEFVWEMSHRLPFHEGPCKNIHGHTYKMLLELVGEVNENRMLIDFYDIEKIVRPLLDKIDHSFLVDSNDDLMLNFLKENQFKYYEIDNFSTAEDMSAYFLEILKPEFQKFDNLKEMKIRVYETADAWAESESSL